MIGPLSATGNEFSEPWTSRTLDQFAPILRSGLDLPAFVELFATRFSRLLGPCAVTMVFCRPNDLSLTVIATTELAATLERSEQQANDGPSGEVRRTGRAVRNAKFGPRSRWPRFASEARAIGFRAVEALPMHGEEQLIGVVSIFHAGQRVLDTHEATAVQAIVDIASFAIAKTWEKGTESESGS